MIYVLEGINGVGKSSVARYINDRFNIPAFRNFKDSEYFLNPRFANKAIEELVVANFLGRIKIVSSIVLDRSLISSYVYNKVFGHDKTIKFVHKNLVVWMNELHNGPNGPLNIIYIDGEAKKCIKRIGAKKNIFKLDGVGELDNAKAIQDEYNFIMANLKDTNDKVNFIKIYNNNTLSDLYTKAKDIFSNLESGNV